MDRQPITQKGYRRIRAEIRQIEEEKMPPVVEAIALARAEGDLSENAEYHGQRETLGMLQAKVQQLKGKLANCEIVDKSKLPSDAITFGSRVVVKNLDDDLEEHYEFVGPGEEDYSDEVLKILTTSPLASGLLGKKIGERVSIEVPQGTLRFEVIAIDNS